jgi:hypothetical protein
LTRGGGDDIRNKWSLSAQDTKKNTTKGITITILTFTIGAEGPHDWTYKIIKVHVYQMARVILSCTLLVALGLVTNCDTLTSMNVSYHESLETLLPNNCPTTTIDETAELAK